MTKETKKYANNAERQAAYRARKAATKALNQPEMDKNSAAVARGRPKQYATAAERQAAYRARLKERGMRVVSHVVRDVRDTEKPLHSDIIDLSEVRQSNKR